MYNWPNLQTLFEEINKDNNYIVLRNFEELSNNMMVKGHEDIDILCDDVEKMVRTIHGKKESQITGHFDHYFVSVDSKIIEIGIRYIGDGYYDAAWERKLLEKRKLWDDLFWVIDDENYFYSLIYHAMLHKKRLSEDYKTRLTAMASARNLSASTPEQLGDVLISYMQEHDYEITYPVDTTVPFDVNNLSHSKPISVSISGMKEWKRRRFWRIPIRTLRYIYKRL